MLVACGWRLIRMWRGNTRGDENIQMIFDERLSIAKKHSARAQILGENRSGGDVT